MRILVTGGTGHLGRAIVSGLKRDGHTVRILARRPRLDSSVEWIGGDLATGEGLRDAVADVQAVIHAATNSPAAQRGRFALRDLVRSPADVDVAGTRELVRAAERAGVEQFIHVSIAGLEQLRRMPYARRKLEAERLVRDSNLPWSIVRATAFYWLARAAAREHARAAGPGGARARAHGGGRLRRVCRARRRLDGRWPVR
jgi:uncharacterized protein YbjT (DUF2867 family)